MADQAPDKIVIPQDGTDVVSWLFEVDGVARDFTDWDGRLQIRRSKARTSTLLVDLSVENGLLELTDDGYVRADFNAEVMADVPIGSWPGDLCLVDPIGQVSYPIIITFVSPASVTEPPGSV